MAKIKSITEEKEKPVSIDPCWSRYPAKAASYCNVSIGVGGAFFHGIAEFTEKEERDTKDLPALKLERIKDVLTAVHAMALESLDG